MSTWCPSAGMSCMFSEEYDVPDQYDDDGNFVEGGATLYRCNWHSTLIEFDDGDYEWTEPPCA